MMKTILTVGMLAFLCFAQVQAIGLLPQQPRMSIPMPFLMDFADGNVTVRSVPVQDFDMSEGIKKLQKLVPTKRREWEQLREWVPAILRLRSQDVKLAEYLNAQKIQDKPMIDSFFELEFKPKQMPKSCSKAQSKKRSLSHSAASVKDRFRNPKDHIVRYVDFIGECLLCHFDLLEQSAEAGHEDVTLRFKTLVLHQYADGMNVLQQSSIEALAMSSEPKKACLWRRVIPNIKMDEGGTTIDLLFLESSCFAVKNFDHMRSLELAIATLMLPVHLLVVPVRAGIGGTQQVHRIRNRLSSHGIPTFLAEDELNKIEHDVLAKTESDVAVDLPAYIE